jgi:hypothetical protein
VAIWKPKPFIRVKVLGLVWRGSELLAGEVENSAGQVTGVRPLGGCVEFGETREEALRREFREELGCETIVSGPWHSLENIFEHEGARDTNISSRPICSCSTPGSMRRTGSNIWRTMARDAPPPGSPPPRFPKASISIRSASWS